MMMEIISFQRRVVRLLEKIKRDRNQSPNLNQMCVVMLIYTEKATTNNELAQEMRKTVPSVKALLRSLMKGSTKGRTGFQFVSCGKRGRSHGPPENVYCLTPAGKRFAKIIQQNFE